jgi:hypothetical protein
MSSVSNGLYFLTLPLVSVMRVIYTSKGMSKKCGVCVIHMCALSIENTVLINNIQNSVSCFGSIEISGHTIEPKHVAEFLILSTNIFCVID